MKADDWVNGIKKQTDPFGNSKKTGFSGLSKQSHHVNHCTAKEPNCINNIQENGRKEGRGKDILANHTYFDKCCPTYIKLQPGAVARKILEYY